MSYARKELVGRRVVGGCDAGARSSVLRRERPTPNYPPPARSRAAIRSRSARTGVEALAGKFRGFPGKFTFGATANEELISELEARTSRQLSGSVDYIVAAWLGCLKLKKAEKLV